MYTDLNKMHAKEDGSENLGHNLVSQLRCQREREA